MAAKAIVHRIEDDNFAGETKTQRMQEGNLELISPHSVGGVPCNPVSLNTADSFCCPFRRKRFPARPPLEPCSFFSSFLSFFFLPLSFPQLQDTESALAAFFSFFATSFGGYWGLLHLKGLEVCHDEPHPWQPFACLAIFTRFPWKRSFAVGSPPQSP